MANAIKKNSIFVDTVGDLTVSAMKPMLKAIMVTPNAANSRVTIKESSGGTTVLDITIESVETRYISFEAFGGIELNTTFDIETLTFIDSVILYGEWKAPVNKAVG